ncbi:MAG: hypothetical protein P4M07_16890 [Xanthobacteraceae bacterium]|nr:hypothetical protein [Xanthobacteraceae bacterium]
MQLTGLSFLRWAMVGGGIVAGLPAFAPPAFAADLAATPAATAQSFDQRWKVTFSDEVQYYSWDSSQGYPHIPLQFPPDPRGPAHGYQVYNPFGLQLDGKATDDLQVQMLIRSGYLWSGQTNAGVSANTATTTDTTLGTTLTYNGIAGYQPFVSLNVNAPTGQTVLLGTNALARPDPDVAAVGTFGQGWNVGPTAGVNIALAQNLIATLSTGYTYRGTFNSEGMIPVVGVQGIASNKPGDDWTANAMLNFQPIDTLLLQLGGAFTVEGTTLIDGVPIFKTGDKFVITGGARYLWTPQLASQLNGTFTHIDRNKIQSLAAPFALFTEAVDSNSNITQLLASTTYTLGQVSFGPTGGFTYRDHNDYDPTLAAFLPAKTGWVLGAMASWVASQQVTLTARGEHRWIHENENPNLGPLLGFPAITTNVWVAAVAGTVKF